MKRITVLFGTCLTALFVQSAMAQSMTQQAPATSSSATGKSSAVHEACADDMSKFCSDVQAGDHKAMQKCMKAHHNDLSAGCKSAMKSAHQEHETQEQTPKQQ
jgi:hypothetical protein